MKLTFRVVSDGSEYSFPQEFYWLELICFDVSVDQRSELTRRNTILIVVIVKIKSLEKIFLVKEFFTDVTKRLEYSDQRIRLSSVVVPE